jgi:hypothetical protein
MKAIGLQPSNTGAVDGKETGPQMTHYSWTVHAFVDLAKIGWKLNLESARLSATPRARRAR